MNRIDKLFANKKDNILSVYFTAGFPKVDDTITIIKELEKNGVDLIEIGMPFSDPMADGPVIQESSHQALLNGMSLHKLFDQLKDIRKSVDIPLILMGYLNPVLRFGMEAFLNECSNTGIDGIILPDLPLLEYTTNYAARFKQHDVHNIFLISPQTNDDRIRLIDQTGSGFIYMVSSASITGSRKGISEEQKAYFNRIKNMNLKNPALIGFGISNHETFRTACKYAQGAIIGSAFINAISDKSNLQESIKDFIQHIKNDN